MWIGGNYNPYIFVTGLFIYANVTRSLISELNNSPDDIISLTIDDFAAQDEGKEPGGNCKRFICTQQSTAVN